jgi:hypothetical protein
MSERDPVARLRAITNILAQRSPTVLVAAAALLESVLEATNQDVATEHVPTAPAALTAEQVLGAALTRGVPAFAVAFGGRQILLASLGLDLTEPRIRTALVDMHRRGELRLARIGNIGTARADLAARGLRSDLVEESAIDGGDKTFHVVVLP